MRSILFPAAVAVALAAGGLAIAQTSALTINTNPAKAGGKLAVTSPAFATGAMIPLANTAYATPPNTFPGLGWSGAPAGTQSFAVILEDPDIAGRPPFLHWYVLNLPANATSISPGAPGTAPMPAGTTQGGVRDGYFGPRTPAGAPHNYHFQVFALDTKIDVPARSPLPAVVAAMKGHVLASGEVIGKFDGTPYASAAPAGRPAGAPAAPAAAPAPK